MPFDLHPEYPPEGIRRADLSRRYGDAFVARTREMIEAAGLPYGPGEVVPNSMGALALAEHARDEDRHQDVHERLFAAYWAEGRDIGDPKVLEEVAGAAGLDPRAAARARHDDHVRERIRKSTDSALESGVSGVPAWVIDGVFLVPGAQPHEVFERVLARLGHEPVEG